MSITRSEHPRPQFVRKSWRNLNGKWDFEFDFGNSGLEQKYLEKKFSKKINLPFCPESELSGIGYKDFMAAVWYRRIINITPSQLDGRVLLHFGAVDYKATLWVGDKLVGTHNGGYSSFSFDITEFCTLGDNTVTLRAQDDLRSGNQPTGKQCTVFNSFGCSYTRTTGIWQTVWLEFTPKTYISGVRVFTNYKSGEVSVEATVVGCRKDTSLRVTASFEGKRAATATEPLCGDTTRASFKINNPKLWEPGTPNLYDVKYELVRDGKAFDKVDGYFGIRGIELRGHGFYLNGKPVFQRLVLDQGFYPDGIYTAPTDEALRRDIELSMQMGFNGARLHQKVFEERFLYWADKLGYMVWGEQASWGLDISDGNGLFNFLPEWLEVLRRDFNHPAIVGWCPFNETWDSNGKQQDNNVLRDTYLVTKAFDNTRPCIDTSGNFHVITDIYDIHDYEQNVEKYKARYSSVSYDELFENFPARQHKEGQPYFVSEFGGTWWAPGRTDGWGYGQAPESEAEVGARIAGLMSALLANPEIIAYCYTQLTDVEQEQNGIYAYDRTGKFSASTYEQIRRANTQPSAFELQK